MTVLIMNKTAVLYTRYYIVVHIVIIRMEETAG